MKNKSDNKNLIKTLTDIRNAMNTLIFNLYDSGQAVSVETDKTFPDIEALEKTQVKLERLIKKLGR